MNTYIWILNFSCDQQNTIQPTIFIYDTVLSKTGVDSAHTAQSQKWCTSVYSMVVNTR